MPKKEQAPPPPALQQAYDDLLARYTALTATPHGAVAAEDGERARAQQRAESDRIAQATAELRREVEDLKARCETLRGEAERSRNAARLAQQELAAARANAAPAPGKAEVGLRSFVYIQGDPRTGPREYVRARTQMQADEAASNLLAQGYRFRGCQA
jgi:septal ring factor EnvC (AmiA/AmiB activator)